MAASITRKLTGAVKRASTLRLAVFIAISFVITKVLTDESAFLYITDMIGNPEWVPLVATITLFVASMIAAFFLLVLPEMSISDDKDNPPTAAKSGDNGNTSPQGKQKQT